MSSPAQIAANRTNAELSTGPKSSEGKSVSSKNARKHGLLTDLAFVPDEDFDELFAFAQGVESDLKPEGDLEQSLVARIVGLLWRLRRAGRLEIAVLSVNWARVREKNGQSKDAVVKFANNILRRGQAYVNGADTLAKLSRYESSIQRNLLRMMHELQRLQAARTGGHVPAPQVVDVDVTGLAELRGTGDERD